MIHRAPIRWEKVREGGFSGYSGDLHIAYVFQYDDDTRWQWRLQIRTKYICANEGARKDLAAAKRAAETAWGKWLDHAALTPAADTSSSSPVAQTTGEGDREAVEGALPTRPEPILWSPAKTYGLGDVVTIDAPIPEPWWSRALVALGLRKPRYRRRTTGYIAATCTLTAADPRISVDQDTGQITFDPRKL